MTYIRQHEEVTNNKYVTIKRRKRGAYIKVQYRALHVVLTRYSCRKPSICPSVRLSVRPSVTCSLNTPDAVRNALSSV